MAKRCQKHYQKWSGNLTISFWKGSRKFRKKVLNYPVLLRIIKHSDHSNIILTINSGGSGSEHVETLQHQK